VTAESVGYGGRLQQRDRGTQILAALAALAVFAGTMRVGGARRRQ
jgi:hypothetical protein